jgi:nicotinate-nucleotide pyrophosphorylase (carboxylating)
MRLLITQALQEDTGRGDPTTAATIHPSQQGEAYLLAKADGILAGVGIAGEVFSIYHSQSGATGDIQWTPLVEDSSIVRAGTHLAKIEAPLAVIVTAERVALNLLQRMSGIATLTSEYVKLTEGTKAKILDTRKTAPLLRPFDRYGVLCGGGVNHRYSLAEMIMVKDNHLAANRNDIPKVIDKLRTYFLSHPKLPVEIEVTSLEQLDTLLTCGKEIVTRVMFDNFTLEDLRKGVEMNISTFETEASGGVNLTTVKAIAQTGVDFISAGALTHSVIGLDISLEVQLYVPEFTGN